MSKVSSLEALQDKCEHDLRVLLPSATVVEDTRRLTRALHNLRRFTEILRRDAHVMDCAEPALHWDSWVERLNEPPTTPAPINNNHGSPNDPFPGTYQWRDG